MRLDWRRYRNAIGKMMAQNSTSLRLCCRMQLLWRWQSRVILVSGTPVADCWLVPLYDDLIRLPCELDDLEQAIWRIPEQTRPRLPTEEHVEAAVSSLLREASYIVPGCTSKEDHYAMYREVYPIPRARPFFDALQSVDIKNSVDYLARLAACLQRVGACLTLPSVARFVFAQQISELKAKVAKFVWSVPKEMEQTLHTVEWVSAQLVQKGIKAELVKTIEGLKGSAGALPTCRGELLRVASLLEQIRFWNWPAHGPPGSQGEAAG